MNVRCRIADAARLSSLPPPPPLLTARRRRRDVAASALPLSAATVAALLLTAGGPAQAQAPQPEQDPAQAQVAPGADAPVIRQVEVTGGRELPARQVAEVAEKAVAGRRADPATVRAAAEAVRGLYRANGMPLAQVIRTEVTPEGVLRLTVAEGTVRSVLVRGNGRTQTGVIRRAVAIQPGDVYREDRVGDARNRLGRLGIFEDVVISATTVGAAGEDEEGEEGETAPKEKPGSADAPAAGAAPPSEPPADEVGFVDLVVRVKERRTGNIAATVGYTDGSGLVGFVDISEDNLNGSAQQVSAQWQRFNQSRFTNDGIVIDEDARMAYEIAYAMPALGPRSTAFTINLYDKNTIFLPFFVVNQDTIRSYELRRGGRVSVGRSVARGLSLFVSARRDEVGYDPVPESLNPPVAAIRNSFGTVAALGLTLVADGRDDSYNPRRGHYRTLGFERAARVLGGDRTFNQVRLDLRQYVPLQGGNARSPVIAARLLGGTTNSDTPLSEQFWLGGYELLRGYDLFSIRGNRMLLGAVEGRVPFGQGVQGVLFTEFGNAWVPGARASLGDLKGSVGAGLRFLTPIGPIRFDVAYGSNLQTYVSLGQSY